MVASGRGGWDVPSDTYQRQFEQAQHGRGTLLFDDGWHKLSTALWLFGPVKEVRAWIGSTEVVPGIDVDAPTTVVWEHVNGVRGVWDITLAVDMYLRSDYYTNDERWEVTGRRGFARVNRCTARGIQQPSFEIYLDGETHAFHALDDDWASSFRDSGRYWLRWLRTGNGPLWLGGAGSDRGAARGARSVRKQRTRWHRRGSPFTRLDTTATVGADQSLRSSATLWKWRAGHRRTRTAREHHGDRRVLVAVRDEADGRVHALERHAKESR